jgi:site-specific recombinase XerD
MMLEELQRRNFSEHTIRYYIRTVEDFARHFNRPGNSMSSVSPKLLRIALATL